MADRQATYPSAVILSTSIMAFISGFLLGVYSIRGYWLCPDLKEERRRNLKDPAESEESDIDESDSLLDHAPNWANAEEADRRQGLRIPNGWGKDNKGEATAVPSVPFTDVDEECKLVLVVRTDLGMTKGKTSYVSPVTLCGLSRG
jgi:PTH2 family peptidyl-tRNA hydrolase